MRDARQCVPHCLLVATHQQQLAVIRISHSYQQVHCVVRKIGEIKTHKVYKKRVNFTKPEGKEKFLEWGYILKYRKWRGNSKFVANCEKRSSEFLADENRKFLSEKVKL